MSHRDPTSDPSSRELPGAIEAVAFWAVLAFLFVNPTPTRLLLAIVLFVGRFAWMTYWERRWPID